MFNPSAPNPYGSFYDPMFMANAMGQIPSMNMGFDSALGSLMGHGSGGMNPGSAEYSMSQFQQRKNMELLKQTHGADARANSALDWLLTSAYGNDQRRIHAAVQQAGGRPAMVQALGGVMNMPGISGYLGGNIASLGVGALAVAGGGGIINSEGAGAFGAFGSGTAQRMAARRVFDMVNQNFYGAGGQAFMGMTHGLNRDQVGGIMALGSSQGAFSGMNMGNLSRGPNGQLNFNLDDAARNKITEFTRQAAKTMASLKDIFGDRSMGELANIAKQITGLDLSRMDNVRLMGERIQGIKNTAMTMGVDVRTAMDVTAKGTQMGMTLGLSEAAAGSFSTLVAPGNMMASRLSQNQSGDWYNPGPSFSERQAMSMRDNAALSTRDPSGVRLAALEYFSQTGTFKNSPEDSYDTLKGYLTPHTMTGVGQFDQAMAQQFGMSMPSFLGATHGGADLVNNMLKPENIGKLANANQGIMDKESLRRVNLSLRNVFVGNPRLAQLGTDLYGKMDRQVFVDAADAVSKGDMAGLDKILARDNYTSNHDLAGTRSQLLELGKMGNAGTLARQIEDLAGRDPFAANFSSASERSSQHALSLEARATWHLDSNMEGRIQDYMNQGSQGFFTVLGRGEGEAQIAAMMKFRGGKDFFGGLANNRMFLRGSDYEGLAQGQLSGAGKRRFIETWNALPKEIQNQFRTADSRFEDVGFKQGMGNSDYAQLAGILTRNFEDQESRFKTYGEFEMLHATSGSYMLARRTAVNDMIKNMPIVGVLGMMQSNLEARGAQGYQSDLFKDMIAGYARGEYVSGVTGKTVSLTDATGKFIGSSGSLKNLMGTDILSKLGDETIREISKNSQELAAIANQNIINSIQYNENREVTDPGNKKTYQKNITELRRVQGLLAEGQGITGLSTIEQIVGTLTLVGPQGDELTKAVVKAHKAAKK